jgi:hypothetical protein
MTMNVTEAVESIKVGTQNGTMTAGTAGDVTFAVTTTGFADGPYRVSVSGRPEGVSVVLYAPSVELAISRGKGTLSLRGNTSTVAGTYTGLTLSISGHSVTSEPFTLTIGEAPAPTGISSTPLQ